MSANNTPENTAANSSSPDKSYCLFSPGAQNESGDLLEGKNETDAITRIQALLTDWLRMENLVVFTAAGCSVSSGGKTIQELEKAVIEILNASTTLNANAKKIVAARKAGGSKLNFEAWLSYIANALTLPHLENSPIEKVSWSGGASLSKEEAAQLLDYAGKSIFTECAVRLLKDSEANFVTGHIPFLAKLVARDSNLGRTHLFTLNYDTLFEQGMEELGIQYFDGFTGRADARFDPAVYGLDIYFPGDVAEGRVRRFDKFLQFYKLHGSIHWTQNENGDVRARHPDLENLPKGLDYAGKAKLIDENKQTIGGGTLGILPTASKFVQTLAMPYAHLFRLLHARLSQPQTFLLILGYGFNDEHINRIIETALMNPSLVLLVVEPNLENKTVGRIKKHQALGQRAFVLTPSQEAFGLQKLGSGESKLATFDDFAKKIMPDVQWLKDYKKLRQLEKELDGSNKITATPK